MTQLRMLALVFLLPVMGWAGTDDHIGHMVRCDFSGSCTLKTCGNTCTRSCYCETCGVEFTETVPAGDDCATMFPPAAPYRGPGKSGTEIKPVEPTIRWFTSVCKESSVDIWMNDCVELGLRSDGVVVWREKP